MRCRLLLRLLFRLSSLQRLRNPSDISGSFGRHILSYNRGSIHSQKLSQRFWNDWPLFNVCLHPRSKWKWKLHAIRGPIRVQLISQYGLSEETLHVFTITCAGFDFFWIRYFANGRVIRPSPHLPVYALHCQMLTLACDIVLDVGPKNLEPHLVRNG